MLIKYGRYYTSRYLEKKRKEKILPNENRFDIGFFYRTKNDDIDKEKRLISSNMKYYFKILGIGDSDKYIMDFINSFSNVSEFNENYSMYWFGILSKEDKEKIFDYFNSGNNNFLFYNAGVVGAVGHNDFFINQESILFMNLYSKVIEVMQDDYNIYCDFDNIYFEDIKENENGDK